MATSFSNQIDTIVNLMTRLAPSRVLDIGKGFGKYGFLLHEYYGIDNNTKPDATKTLAQQSRVTIDAVECNQDYLWPHIAQFYSRVFVGRIEDMYLNLHGYDTVLMLDVIEHLQPSYGKAIIEHFIYEGSTMVISTPNVFFNQELYDSPEEHHVSFWGPGEMSALGFPFDYQTVGLGRVFLISSSTLDIRGFGHSSIKRLRRIARSVINELH
jgi:2-polyprenyl-3-methyl-5-hydroxy-6-metoxy-1,4-benzoquinol methylase